MLNRFNTIQAFVLVLLCFFNGQAQPMSNEVVTYSILKPDHVKQGKEFQLKVMFNVLPGWYIYAPNGLNTELGKIETKVVFTSRELKKAGKIKIPASIIKDGYQVYEGDSIMMSQAFNAASKFGRYEILGKVTYQTCNSDICLPPVIEEIVVIVQIK